MIVCSCNVLSDHDVRAAIGAEQTPRTTGQVYGCLGCSAQCGRCARTIRRIMDDAGRGGPRLLRGRSAARLNQLLTIGVFPRRAAIPPLSRPLI